jgi:hypothetical protein
MCINYKKLSLAIGFSALLLLVGCSSAELNKSLQSIGIKTQQGPKPILVAGAFDKKDYSVFSGKWTTGESADKDPEKRVLSNFEFPTRGDGYGTATFIKGKQICNGRARVKITGSNTFELTSGTMSCNDSNERGVSLGYCTVSDNEIEARCTFPCVNTSSLELRICEKTFQRPKS